MNNVIIFSTEKLYNSNSAGGLRTLNYAKILAGQNTKVFFTYRQKEKIEKSRIEAVGNNIYNIQPKKGFYSAFMALNLVYSAIYAYRLAKFAKSLKGNVRFILYPTSDPTIELPAILIIKRIFGFPLFCEVNELRYTIVNDYRKHSNFFKEKLINLHRIIRLVWYKFNERLSVFFDGLIVISTSLERYYKKYNKNICRIPILTSINSKVSEFRNDKQENDGKFIILFTGQVDFRKEALEILLKSLRIVANQRVNIELHLYGPISKTDRKKLEKLVSELDLAKIVFYHGTIDQKRIMNLLRTGNLLILLRPENLQNSFGFSSKLAEYLSSGTPVLLTNVSDNKLFIRDGYNGFLVDELDQNLIAKKILYIIENYSEIKDKVWKNSIYTAKQYFDISNYTELLPQFLHLNL